MNITAIGIGVGIFVAVASSYTLWKITMRCVCTCKNCKCTKKEKMDGCPCSPVCSCGQSALMLPYHPKMEARTTFKPERVKSFGGILMHFRTPYSDVHIILIRTHCLQFFSLGENKWTGFIALQEIHFLILCIVAFFNILDWFFISKFIFFNQILRKASFFLLDK